MIFNKSKLVFAKAALMLCAHVGNAYFEVFPLVDNNGEYNAPFHDPRLLNPWGLTFKEFGDHQGDLIVADNGNPNFLATSYDEDGMIESFDIPIISGSGPFDPTGLVSNNSFNFLIGTFPNRHPAQLLFSSEAGKVLAFNKHVSDAAIVVIDNSAAGAVYKGITIASNFEGCIAEEKRLLYVADFFHARVDIYDSEFNFVNSFESDPNIPDGYAPFNVENIDGLIYVAFAKQDDAHHDDVPGLGFGYVSVFFPDGTLKKTLISQGLLNAPWGMAHLSWSFGFDEDALAVGNFGDGKIHVYDMFDGDFLGTLKDENYNDIVIDGLWALKTDPFFYVAHELYFTSGPDEEADGLVGYITMDHYQ